jgi:16S rRNA (cytidine1402-2'-O)-methyltransferase
MQKSFKEEKPILYIVSTPIGNLKDITFRAIDILNEVDAILCEDTRTSGVLLNHYQIKKPLISYHEFNKLDQENRILNLLIEGKNLALISDAGTPGISDPGFEIIQKVIEKGYFVVSIPGPSAILAALVSSGLIIQPFTFLGFLPRKQSEMKDLLKGYVKRKETLVIYESPMRIAKTLEILFQVLGNRKIALSRELTKTFETIIRTTLLDSLTMEHNTKGEYVIIIEGDHVIQTEFDETIENHVKRYMLQGNTEKDSMKLVAKDRNTSKSEVYAAIKINKQSS